MSDTSAVSITALTGSFLGLTVVITGLRFCARHRLKTPLMVDDWLMLLALITFIGISATVLCLVHIKAIGYSSFQFTVKEKIARYDRSTKLQTSLVALSITCLACTKASALFFYKRIFCVRGQKHGIFGTVLIVSIVAIACWFITFLFLDIFQCDGHFSGLWDTTLYKQHCKVTWNFLYGYAISDVLLDVLVLVLPISSILRLRITTMKKLSVLAVFMVGCVALAASLVRMVIYIRIYILGVDKYNSLDSERILSQYVFYYVLECGFSIMAINLPSVWPLFSGAGLNSITKLARGVSSFMSRSTRASERSSTKSTSTDHESSHVIIGGEKSGNSMVIARDLSISDISTSGKFEILRQDSIQISTELRKPEDVHWREEGW